MCHAVTEGILSRDCKLVRKHVYVKLYKIFRIFLHVNLLYGLLTMYVYIDSYTYTSMHQIRIRAT